MRCSTFVAVSIVAVLLAMPFWSHPGAAASTNLTFGSPLAGSGVAPAKANATASTAGTASTQTWQAPAWQEPLNRTGLGISPRVATGPQPGAAAPQTPFGLPAWTYKPDLVTPQDPINLVFYGADWTVVRDAFYNQGWKDVGFCQHDEYVYYAGSWRKQDIGIYRDSPDWDPCAGWPGNTRRHIRLWGLESGLVVGGAHLDYSDYGNHVAVQFEDVESTAAYYMRLTDGSPWRVLGDDTDYYLSNIVDKWQFGFHTFNNGYATVLWRQTGASANIYDGLTTTLLEVPNWGGIRDFNNNQVQVYSLSGTVRWSLWYVQTYSSGSVASGGVATVNYPHWTAWIMTIWLEESSSSKMGAIMCKENDGTLGCITLAGGRSVNVGNNISDYVFDMWPTFGGVRDSGSASDNRRVQVYSLGGYIEWALWHQGSYTQGEVLPGGTRMVTFPDAKVFMVLFWRMNVEPQYYERKYVGFLLCREDNNWLGCMFMGTGMQANTADSVPDTLSQIAAIGGVRDTGDPVKTHVVRIYANSPSAIEGAYWTEGTYSGHDTTSTYDFTFAHYRFFVFVAARYGRLMWLFCRENDNTLGCFPLRYF